jgi:dienelactone hydrolase
MGAYSVLHSLEYFADDEIQNTVLVSPPAFPASVHRLTYADGSFGQTVRSDWDMDTSPAWPLVAAISNRTLMSYFEYDDPPIPAPIRERYEQEGGRNPHVTVEQIDGVGHNFRDPLAPYVDAKIDEATMIATSARVARFLQTAVVQ